MQSLACPSENHLRAFQLGDLPEAFLDEVAAHLERCQECETLAQQLDTECDRVLSAISGKLLVLDSSHTRVLAPLPTPHKCPAGGESFASRDSGHDNW